MQKLIIATIGLSLSMGVAATAIAQSAQTAGQMQTAPATNGDGTTAMPSGPASGSAPSTSSTQGDPAANNNMGSGMSSGGMSSGGMSSGGMSSGGMSSGSTPSSYPRCSATVHDECRQRK